MCGHKVGICAASGIDPMRNEQGILFLPAARAFGRHVATWQMPDSPSARAYYSLRRRQLEVEGAVLGCLPLSSGSIDFWCGRWRPTERVQLLQGGEGQGRGTHAMSRGRG